MIIKMQDGIYSNEINKVQCLVQNMSQNYEELSDEDLIKKNVEENIKWDDLPTPNVDLIVGGESFDNFLKLITQTFDNLKELQNYKLRIQYGFRENQQ